MFIREEKQNNHVQTMESIVLELCHLDRCQIKSACELHHVHVAMHLRGKAFAARIRKQVLDMSLHRSRPCLSFSDA